MHQAIREVDICRAAGEYLQSRGWRVVREVPNWARSVDLGATRNGELLLLEAKTSFTEHLQRQVYGCVCVADYAVAVVGTNPRPDRIEWAKKVGAGLWTVTPGGVVSVLVAEAKLAARHNGNWQRVYERTLRMREAIDGGLPCLKGVGPALTVEAEIARYRVSHPGATWAEMFDAIPSHYASARSMESSYRTNTDRRAMIERLRRDRTADQDAANRSWLLAGCPGPSDGTPILDGEKATTPLKTLEP